MSKGFGVVLLDSDGRVVDYALPLEMPYTVLREAVSLGYDVYRVVNTVIGELGYKPPRHISIKLDNYEVSILKRPTGLLLVVFYEEPVKQTSIVKREAVVES